MKKVIIMLSLFAVIITFAGLDLWHTSRFYSKTIDNIAIAGDSIQANRDNINNAETMHLVNKANDEWEKGKRVMMMLVNHNVIRLVDEKFVSLIEQTRTNNYLDAIVTARVLRSYVADLKEENLPLLRNIL